MSGILAQAGFADATSWTQAHQTATQRLRLVSENLSNNYDKIRSKALIGQAADHEFVNGHMMVTGELVVELCYDDDEIIEYCMGAVSSRNYSFTNQLSKWFHLTIDRVTARYHLSPCIVNSFTISGDINSEDPVHLSMNVTARMGVTSGTAFPSIGAAGDPVMFKHLAVFRVGDQDDALTSGDNFPIKTFEITSENSLQADAKDSSDQNYVIIPLRNGPRTVALKLGIARYLASGPISSLQGWKAAATRLQSIATFSSGANSYTIYLPEMKLSEGGDFNVGGPAILETDVTLEAFYNNNNSILSTREDQMEIVAV